MRSRVEEKIKSEETQRVLPEAEEAIHKAVEERVAGVVARLPGEGDLVDDIQRRVTDQRERHWTDVVELLADEMLKGAHAASA